MRLLLGDVEDDGALVTKEHRGKSRSWKEKTSLGFSALSQTQL